RRGGSRYQNFGVMALSPRQLFQHVVQLLQDFFGGWLRMFLKKSMPLPIPVVRARMQSIRPQAMLMSLQIDDVVSHVDAGFFEFAHELARKGVVPLEIE